ncbi:MAG TPA: hypothetical protein P5562_03045 [Candidatus Woesebacteria bacterium]|nr:hypothetical protein [Candidatus Woesebacteria bacterium]
MKHKKYLFLIIFNLIAILYLIQPVPNLPDLPQSVKSSLPGDTIQISHVRAYFTNLSRAEVIDFYRTHYRGLGRIIINHPPEKAKEIFVDTIQSYYLEEFILPFKESLYINGFEWENDVFTKPEKRIANKLIYENQTFKSKVTIRTFSTSISQRLMMLLLTEVILFFICKSYQFGRQLK